MKTRSLKPLTETKYLSIENSWRYRHIMRHFYACDLKYKHWLNKEDVFSALCLDDSFDTYTLELCQQDLESLCKWGNLTAVQDTTKVTTYQQFVNKQYRYQMTEYAIEIERMTVRIENIFVEGGSLEPTLLERIRESLKALKGLLKGDHKEMGGWWSQLINDFQRLNQTYQDYIRDWNSAKAEELMKTNGFILYKEKLLDYFRRFIQALQNESYSIQKVLQNISSKEKLLMYEKIVAYELEIPRVDMEHMDETFIMENVRGKYESLERFFMGDRDQVSEVDTILSMTNEIIRRITRYAASILELNSQYSNRKEEYMVIAKHFFNMADINQAHLFSARVFGVNHYKHFISDEVRQTESIFSSILSEPAIEVVVSPRIRTYREKMKKTALIDHGQVKKKMRERVLEKRQEEKTILMTYLASGQVAFEALDVIPEKVRKTLMRWLAKGMQEKGGFALTEHGQRFKVLNPNEKKRCTLRCEDGEMDMPAYILKFEE